ncbi:SDR family NAD(P)-dependent oxidoreductase [Sphaerimonospora thailandensis]|uniref:Short subunit dehydrogenase n=1 Tax=Sphaerimonospora thailandensis TaxID=795644 RepID=A0A8J3REM7_9ACTN|nr:SDR family NAD(P)-dependent oxidoreductase [Sphaerimonospora thailandensis]GIH72432.1 hypothetical protein Mth01_46850 [Sphaerimonospora thailandensis]
MTDARGFENRVAFVTGAGNGIGREMARDVVRQGGKVAIADVDLAAAEGLGGIDVLVNNAGLHLMKWNVPVTSVTAKQWHQILGVNGWASSTERGLLGRTSSRGRARRSATSRRSPATCRTPCTESPSSASGA